MKWFKTIVISCIYVFSASQCNAINFEKAMGFLFSEISISEKGCVIKTPIGNGNKTWVRTSDSDCLMLQPGSKYQILDGMAQTFFIPRSDMWIKASVTNLHESSMQGGFVTNEFVYSVHMLMIEISSIEGRPGVSATTMTEHYIINAKGDVYNLERKTTSRLGNPLKFENFSEDNHKRKMQLSAADKNFNNAELELKEFYRLYECQGIRQKLHAVGTNNVLYYSREYTNSVISALGGNEVLEGVKKSGLRKFARVVANDDDVKVASVYWYKSFGNSWYAEYDIKGEPQVVCHNQERLLKCYLYQQDGKVICVYTRDKASGVEEIYTFDNTDANVSFYVRDKLDEVAKSVFSVNPWRSLDRKE